MKLAIVIALFLVLCTFAYAQDPAPAFASLGSFADTAAGSKSEFTALLFPTDAGKYKINKDDTVAFATTFTPEFKTALTDVKCTFRFQGVVYKDNVNVVVVDYAAANSEDDEVQRTITASFTYAGETAIEVSAMKNNVYVLCTNVANADTANAGGAQYFGSATVTITPKEVTDTTPVTTMTAPMAFAPVSTESLKALNLLTLTFQNGEDAPAELTYIDEEEAQKIIGTLSGAMQIGGISMTVDRVYNSAIETDATTGTSYVIEYIVSVATTAPNSFPIDAIVMGVTFEGQKQLLLDHLGKVGSFVPNRKLVDAGASYFAELPTCFTDNDAECLKTTDSTPCFPCQNKAPCTTDDDCIYICKDNVCTSNSAATIMSFGIAMMMMMIAIIGTFIF